MIDTARATMTKLSNTLLPQVDTMLFADKSKTQMSEVKTLLKSIATEMSSLLQSEKEIKALVQTQKA